MRLIWFDKIESTQDYIKSHIGDLESDTIVISDIQTKGRGRYGHSWYSFQREGLYFSFLKKHLDIPVLPLITGVSLFKTVKAMCDVTPIIKWPNDIYLFLEKPRKLAGILVEKIKQDMIVGVGINLNQEDFPQDIDAISLKLFTDRYVDKKAFLRLFFDIFEKDLGYFDQYGFGSFRTVINDNLLYKNRLITANDGKIRGILKEIDEFGNIVLDIGSDVIKLNAGEIEKLRDGSM